MEKAKILERLIKEKGYSVRSFAQKSGIPESTLYTILKKGVGRATVDNVIIICRNLGIKVEELEEMANGKAEKSIPTYEEIERLIARNGKNISKDEKMKLIQIISSIKED